MKAAVFGALNQRGPRVANGSTGAMASEVEDVDHALLNGMALALLAHDDNVPKLNTAVVSPLYVALEFANVDCPTPVLPSVVQEIATSMVSLRIASGVSDSRTNPPPNLFTVVRKARAKTLSFWSGTVERGANGAIGAGRSDCRDLDRFEIA